MQSSDDGGAGVSVDQNRLIALLKRGIRAVNGRDLTALAAPDLPPGPLDLIAVGKAACAMAQGLLDIRARTVRRALVVTRHGYATPLQTPHGVDVEVRTAGHPIPDAASLEAGEALLRFVTSGDPDTTLIFLLSGGASALVERPLPGMTASDLAQINRWLLASGKPITEINAVRRALSTLKGGRLAARLPYRRTFYWLLSDVVGDDPATIGSGLAAPDTTTFTDALNVLRRHGLMGAVRPTVVTHLELGECGAHPDTPDPRSPRVAGLTLSVVASVRDAVEGARAQAEALGYEAIVLTSTLSGEARDAAAWLADQELPDGPTALIAGGETTVTVQGRGRGGRS
ncbi:MAG: DUF4147 domain-containing protein, partial [Pseudomonadota bacterium]|nr:DUF4147 domain-containing protein [Pseudomonadota bacterium]